MALLKAEVASVWLLYRTAFNLQLLHRTALAFSCQTQKVLVFPVEEELGKTDLL